MHRLCRLTDNIFSIRRGMCADLMCWHWISNRRDSVIVVELIALNKLGSSARLPLNLSIRRDSLSAQAGNNDSRHSCDAAVWHYPSMIHFRRQCCTSYLWHSIIIIDQSYKVLSYAAGQTNEVSSGIREMRSSKSNKGPSCKRLPVVLVHDLHFGLWCTQRKTILR